MRELEKQLMFAGTVFVIVLAILWTLWNRPVKEKKPPVVYADSCLVDTIVFAPSYNTREAKIRRDTIKVKNDWRVITFSMDSAKIYVYVLRAK